MSKLNIRNVLPRDLDHISQIECLCFPAAEADSKKVFKERIAIFSEGFFIAELDGEIIGLINSGITNDNNLKDNFFKTMDLHIPGANNIVIFGLDVHPNYHGSGYGKELMNHFIEYARKSGRKKVLLTCKKHLIKYYEKFGYVNEGLSNSTHGGATWYDMYLVL
ncbi:MAG: GNAT family N-acetyltransferase [Anaeromicrobium sp.]|jgi:ribosomal protein S18 acetylase RimI-like enzyme|uniref:GNAT family N-acetyltransferase n=1 Tax=Anaeromicrobium sp. TaxID=1929132 RepID=UPI0025FD8A57|nr:GNAT family N-acetyltransferase [Anaeromicrobium sp.]MCT4592980.1 GNAT family N-acetyltransferase [Anaeromicrobium sp.]